MEKIGKYGKYVLGIAFAVVVVVLLVAAARSRLSEKPAGSPESVVVEKKVLVTVEVEKPVVQTVVVEKEVAKEVVASPTPVPPTPMSLEPSCPLRGELADGRVIICLRCYSSESGDKCDYRIEGVTGEDFYIADADKILGNLVWWEPVTEESIVTASVPPLGKNVKILNPTMANFAENGAIIGAYVEAGAQKCFGKPLEGIKGVEIADHSNCIDDNGVHPDAAGWYGQPPDKSTKSMGPLLLVGYAQDSSWALIDIQQGPENQRGQIWANFK